MSATLASTSTLAPTKAGAPSGAVDTGRMPSQRDHRVDVLRGLALWMIFVDHIPDDLVNRVTMHNFGFCDAAEVFVLLAGFSSMLAYGKSFRRDGAAVGLRKIAVRCARIYLFQIALLLTTLGVVIVWNRHYHLSAKIMGPILGSPVAGIAHGLTLAALPSYLDILPLYIVLLAAFPLIYLAIRRGGVAMALGASAAVWVAANLIPGLDLPNWIDGKGWYFNPFAWQFLFTIGAALCVAVGRNNGSLPAIPALRWFAIAFLAFACVETIPWENWGLPDLRPIAMEAPDKSLLNPLRIADILALMYLVLSTPAIRRLAASRWVRPIDLCGRHSLEVFSTGCLLALLARLEFRTEGHSFWMQIVVNVTGLTMMSLVGWMLDHGKRAAEAVIEARDARRAALAGQ